MFMQLNVLGMMEIIDILETLLLMSDSVAMGIDTSVALTFVGVTTVPCDSALRPFLSSIVIRPPDNNINPLKPTVAIWVQL